MQHPTIAFTQETLFKIYNQSVEKYGHNSDAKVYVMDNHGVLETQHFGPEEITPGGVPRLNSLEVRAAKLLADEIHVMD